MSDTPKAIDLIAALNAARTPHDHVEDEDLGALRESAYRRGYQQGAFEMLRAMERGVPLAKIRRYVEEDLTAWRFRWGRYDKPRHHLDFPPRL